MISVFHCKINAVKQPTSLQLQTLPGGHYYGLLTLPKKRRKKATRAKIKKNEKGKKGNRNKLLISYSDGSNFDNKILHQEMSQLDKF